MIPRVPLVLFGLLVAHSANAVAQHRATEFEIDLFIDERVGIAHGGAPLRASVPFPQGFLSQPIPLEIQTDNEPLAVEGIPLAYWPDGSVRWLSCEFNCPPLAPSDLTTTTGPVIETFQGVLRPRKTARLPKGDLKIYYDGNGRPTAVENGVFRLEVDNSAGRLFTIVNAASGNLRSALRSDLLLDNADPWYQIHAASTILGKMAIESSTPLSLTLARRDAFVNSSGRPLAAMTTRVTVFRGNAALKLQQSLDVIAGRHQLRQWSLRFPFFAPGGAWTAASSLGSAQTFTGDFTWQQTAHDRWKNENGVEVSGRLPGVIGMQGTMIAPVHFWELFPSGLRRAGSDLFLDLCPDLGPAAPVVEEGFGRTRTIWWQIGPQAETRTVSDVAKATDQPLHPCIEAKWIADSNALRYYGAPDLNLNERFELDLESSCSEVFDRRIEAPENSYGLQHFGDFFDRLHSIGYYGSLQQEYDPPYVLLQQFLRNGNPLHHDRGMELAYHYADVDVSWYGGAYQHRATKHHTEAWIAGIFTTEIRNRYTSDPLYDGTVESVFLIAEATKSKKYADELRTQLAPEEAHGAAGDELLDRLFLIIGQNELNNILLSLVEGGFESMRAYAAAIAAHPLSWTYGYTDVDADFAPFFAIYGGSWADFPNFHVDVHPIPQMRHQGSHSLIEGVIMAYLVSGERRLLDVILAFGEHHVEWVAPDAIKTVTDQLGDLATTPPPTTPVLTRHLGWSLINVLAVADLLQGIPEQGDLYEALLGTADDLTLCITKIPLQRVDSSIHAGVCMEGLAKHHMMTENRFAERFLPQYASYWATNYYDWVNHGFYYQGNTQSSTQMSGLCLMGLAYSHTLVPDPGVRNVLLDTWDYIPASTAYAKSFGMLYRGSLTVIELLRDIQLQTFTR